MPNAGNSVKIAGLGKYLPEKILTNRDLEKLVDTSDEWITTRTGIEERHIVDNKPASFLGAKAAELALKRAGIKPNDLDLIITATITPDCRFPSTSCFIQKAIGAKDAAVFDVGAACSGFIYAMTVAQAMVGGGFYKNALVIGSEVLTSITDWTDRSTCVLFGDGAGAAVVVPVKSGHGLLGFHLGGDGNLGDLLMLPAGGSLMPASRETVDKKLHTIKMQGNELFRIAVRVMVECAEKALSKSGLTSSDVDLLVPHQANLRIINAVSKRLNLPKEKVFINLHKYGNTSSASIPIGLCESYEQGLLKKDKIILLDSFGGGLVWGSMAIRWI